MLNFSDIDPTQNLPDIIRHQKTPLDTIQTLFGQFHTVTTILMLCADVGANRGSLEVDIVEVLADNQVEGDSSREGYKVVEYLSK